jgi:hypothetical protein
MLSLARLYTPPKEHFSTQRHACMRDTCLMCVHMYLYVYIYTYIQVPEPRVLQLDFGTHITYTRT